jgi:hypothetical protein
MAYILPWVSPMSGLSGNRFLTIVFRIHLFPRAAPTTHTLALPKEHVREDNKTMSKQVAFGNPAFNCVSVLRSSPNFRSFVFHWSSRVVVNTNHYYWNCPPPPPPEECHLAKTDRQKRKERGISQMQASLFTQTAVLTPFLRAAGASAT